MGWYATYRDIHCSWSVPKPSLDVLIRWYELPYASFCHSLVSPRHFPPRLTLKMHTKCVILSTLSAQKKECYSTMRGIHCLWSVSKHSLDAWNRYLGGAPLFILLQLIMGLTKLCSTKVDSQIAHNTRCWTHALSVPKWLVVPKGETSIACEVLHKHPEIHETNGRWSW